MLYQVFVTELGRKAPVGEPLRSERYAQASVSILEAAGKRAHYEVQCKSQGRVSA